jgi:acyl-coenzyme A synthetase/AMP-(fatty) acid ligase
MEYPITREEMINNFPAILQETFLRFSEKPFIVTTSGTSTFGDVNLKANGIAKHLEKKEILDGKGVGIYISDALKFIPSLIGVLKGGNYFIALDILFPKTTIDSIIASANISVVITDSENYLDLKNIVNEEILIINMDDIDISHESRSFHVDEIDYNPNRIAQVLYTSGSTGSPKGAIEDYKYFACVAYMKMATHNLQTEDRSLVLSNFSFTAPLFDLLGSMISGITLCMSSGKWDKNTKMLREYFQLRY